MANFRISDLPPTAQAVFNDLLEKVNDPSGTPASQKVTAQQLYNLFAFPTLGTLNPTSGTSYTVDLTVAYSAITTNSQIDFTASSNRSATLVRSATVIINSSGSPRNFTFNANWI